MSSCKFKERYTLSLVSAFKMFVAKIDVKRHTIIPDALIKRG
jgi:hypothetical protein